MNDWIINSTTWAIDVVFGILFWFIIRDRNRIDEELKQLEDNKVDKTNLLLEKRNADLRIQAIADKSDERYASVLCLLGEYREDNKDAHGELKDGINNILAILREQSGRK